MIFQKGIVLGYVLWVIQLSFIIRNFCYAETFQWPQTKTHN